MASRQCSLCGQKDTAEINQLGQLLGPVGNDLWVHRECAIWSPEVGSAPRAARMQLASVAHD